MVWAVQMSTVEFHPWNSRRADVERPDGKSTRTVPTQGGAPRGSRFWCTFSPVTPVGKRCSMHGRFRNARTMPGATAR